MVKQFAKSSSSITKISKMINMKKIDDPTGELCEFVAQLRYEAIPSDVIQSIKLLMIDWLGSAIAGSGTRPAKALQDFALKMGPSTGPCSDFSGGPNTSAFFASMINAASSHIVEQDDLHNSSVLHPATVVFPALVAAAQDRNISGKRFLVAAVAGYEAGIRVGEFLGRSHYVHFHTTGTAGTLAAAAAVANLIGLDVEKTRHAIGTAGTKAAGLWEFLVDAADSKQVHTANAASSGLFAAYSAEQGVTGAKAIFDGAHGMGAAMSSDSDPKYLNDKLGERWATCETSYKWHSSCRHTHPAADTLLQLMQETGVKAEDITRVVTHVHQAAIDVLGPVVQPTTIHQAKFCMGAVLGLIAVHGKAGLNEFDQFALNDDRVLAFTKIVEMHLDPEIDAAYPARWIGKVTVETKDKKKYHARVEIPKGDPSNSLTEKEIVDKAYSLAQYGGLDSRESVEKWISQIYSLEDQLEFSNIFLR